MVMSNLVDSQSRVRKVLASFFSLAAILCVSGSTIAQASNEGECGFGYRYVEGLYDDVTETWSSRCVKSVWEYEVINDGFDKRTTLMMDEDLFGLPGGTTILKLSLIARCEANQLDAFIASSYVLFNSQNRSYSTNFQYRIDGGKIFASTFVESTSDKSFFVSSPKTFLGRLTTGSNKLSIKFSTSKGKQVSQFPISDLKKYRKKFAQAGCKF